MKKKILVLEGLPAAGKTTFADALSRRHLFSKVNESLGQLGGVWLTDDQRLIFQETIKKYSLAKKAMNSVVIDRGYPSMLAWDYCAEKLGLAKDLAQKKSWVNRELSRGRLFEPDLYIYFVASPELSLVRRQRKETSSDMWSGAEGMKYYLEFCRIFFSDQKFLDRVLFINATTSIDQMINLLMMRLHDS